MATGSKAGLYHNAQSASYLPLTLVRTWLILKKYLVKPMECIHASYYEINLPHKSGYGQFLRQPKTHSSSLEAIARLII